MAELFYSTRTYELVKRTEERQKTIVKLGNLEIGGNRLVVFAGPCSIESEDQIFKIARHVKSCGAHVLRGGAYKPTTSPYRFPGLEEEGLKLLAKVREEVGLPICTEVMDPREVDLVYNYTDMIQVGMRSMQNYRLLKEVGKTDKPVFLKRGSWAKIDELLSAAEYILKEGNEQVVLCERGIVSFEDHVRWSLSLSMVPALQERTHLPIIIDPSHGTGNKNYVTSMSRAAVAAGADGLMIEVHSEPGKSVSDAAQTIDFETFSKTMEDVKRITNAMNKEM
jgi:3-deoxy-7-phosphoheptulonate synthase